MRVVKVVVLILIILTCYYGSFKLDPPAIITERTMTPITSKIILLKIAKYKKDITTFIAI